MIFFRIFQKISSKSKITSTAQHIFDVDYVAKIRSELSITVFEKFYLLWLPPLQSLHFSLLLLRVPVLFREVRDYYCAVSRQVSQSPPVPIPVVSRFQLFQFCVKIKLTNLITYFAAAETQNEFVLFRYALILMILESLQFLELIYVRLYPKKFEIDRFLA